MLKLGYSWLSLRQAHRDRYPYLSLLTIPTYTTDSDSVDIPGYDPITRILSLHIPKQPFYPNLYRDIPV